MLCFFSDSPFLYTSLQLGIGFLHVYVPYDPDGKPNCKPNPYPDRPIIPPPFIVKPQPQPYVMSFLPFAFPFAIIPCSLESVSFLFFYIFFAPRNRLSSFPTIPCTSESFPFFTIPRTFCSTRCASLSPDRCCLLFPRSRPHHLPRRVPSPYLGLRFLLSVSPDSFSPKAWRISQPWDLAQSSQRNFPASFSF